LKKIMMMSRNQTLPDMGSMSVATAAKTKKSRGTQNGSQ